MATEINTCGFSCPQPVLMFLNASRKEPDEAFDVLVDNEASRENVSRAPTNHGFVVEASDEGNGVTRLGIRK